MCDFTPGPWKVVIDDCGLMAGRPAIYPVNEDLDCCIIHWDGFVQQYWSSARGEKEIEANARLIAESPTMHDLLLKLQAVRSPRELHNLRCAVAEVLARIEGAK